MDVASKKSIIKFMVSESSLILSREQDELPSDVPLSSLGFDSQSFVELLISIERNYGVNLMGAGLAPADMKSLDSLAVSLKRFL